MTTPIDVEASIGHLCGGCFADSEGDRGAGRAQDVATQLPHRHLRDVLPVDAEKDVPRLDPAIGVCGASHSYGADCFSVCLPVFQDDANACQAFT
eukprot:CAMPEP_0196721828 /NCGR_PEP_ID=MMETSP1091-20130531/4309_1 /TAXON_ID=302021 /ORGANISM="Rhodomonas sp., Strain CCMP768" /LENGTH=94 /DNA_ID=CAMNT_0042063399 /DNA_START=151 /DNA_END=432 /DNA_ORIENTATION=+